jgi:hypothetical protein
MARQPTQGDGADHQQEYEFKQQHGRQGAADCAHDKAAAMPTAGDCCERVGGTPEKRDGES